jgi:predicted RNase H-like HicB family nuclease
MVHGEAKLSVAGGLAMSPRRYTIQAAIYPGDEGGYVAECLNLSVVTQGETLDETVSNLREAIELHLQGEDLDQLGIAAHSPLLITFEMEPVYA